MTAFALALLLAFLFAMLLVRASLNGLTVMSLNRLAEDEIPAAAAVAGYLRRRQAYLFSLQMGILLSTAGAAILLADALGAAGNARPMLWGFAGAAALLLCLSLVAQVLASVNPQKTFLLTLPLLRALLWIFGAAAVPLGALWEKRMTAAKERQGQEDEDKDEEISALINVGRSEGILEGEDSVLIRGVLEFGDTVAREVMTPRTDMVCAAAQTPLREAAERLARARHTRLPVFEGQIDNIVGVAYLKDFLEPLLAGEGDRPVAAYSRPVPFVPENKPISALLREFQRDKLQLAIVVDEYGGVDGLVTTEDLLEEIVGELQESAESEEAPFTEVSPGVFESLGRASLYDLAEKIGADLPEGDYHSVAGWISTHLGAIPHTGDELSLDGVHVEILSSDRRRIHRVRLRLEPPPGASDGGNGQAHER